MVVSLQPFTVVTISVIVYVPAVVYRCDGFCWVTLGVPSPKFHTHELMALPAPAGDVDPSINVVLELRHTFLGIMAAVGKGFVLAGSMIVFWQPLSDVAVRNTENGPGPLYV